MSVFLIVLTYFAGIFFILAVIIKLIRIARMPVHLRWELAPLPLKKVSSRESRLKSDESKHKQRKSLTAIVLYMAKEIFLQHNIWKHNRTLWPFSLSMHIGIFLVILSALLHVVNALLIIAVVPVSVIDVLKNIAAMIAVIGYFIGCLGAIGLILKRVFDTNYQPFSSFVAYFRLVFLTAIFVSGIAAWFYSADFAVEMSEFIRNILTLNTSVNVVIPLVTHVIISLLFLIYLPLTDMTHFITKYFLYHAVRWNDEPMDKKMSVDLNELETQTINWSAPHIPANKTWTQVTTEKTSHEKTA